MTGVRSHAKAPTIKVRRMGATVRIDSALVDRPSGGVAQTDTAEVDGAVDDGAPPRPEAVDEAELDTGGSMQFEQIADGLGRPERLHRLLAHMGGSVLAVCAESGLGQAVGVQPSGLQGGEPGVFDHMDPRGAGAENAR